MNFDFQYNLVTVDYHVMQIVKVNLLKSCKEGCKVFTVLQLAGKSDDEKLIRNDCQKSCSQAYKEDSLTACSSACTVQTLKKGSVKYP